MNKSLIYGISVLLTIQILGAQEIKMDYIPIPLKGVTTDNYEKGKYFLENTYQSIKEHKNEICYADYWNVALAYSLMGEGKEEIFSLLKRSKKMNNNSFCYIANYQIDYKNGNMEEVEFYKQFGEKYLDLIAECEGLRNPKYSIANNLKATEKMNLELLDEKLINQLIVMMEKDQRYRYDHNEYKNNREEQRRLDNENQKELSEIFEKYGYPGKALVGDKYAGYACLILEHGNELAKQEAYFPLVIEAVKKGDVEKNYVRMLVDRIHWKKTKKQIFGSHFGVPFDDKELIQRIKKAYHL